MADSCPRPLLAKIVLGIGAFFFVTAIVCLAVGGPLYVQERSKIQSYQKDLCRVRSATYETIDKCIEKGTRTMKYDTCYVAVWHVELGQNGTRKEAVRGDGEKSYQAMEIKSQQYKVDSSYPCWYNTNKPSQITWYGPISIYGAILLIIGIISMTIAVAALVISCRLRSRADL